MGNELIDLRERLVRLEVNADHRAETLSSLRDMVTLHADESRAWRAQHDARHVSIETLLTRIQEQTARAVAASAEDTGSVLVEGATAAGKGLGAVLGALPAPVWYIIAAATLGGMGLGSQVAPLMTAALQAPAPAPVVEPVPDDSDGGPGDAP